MITRETSAGSTPKSEVLAAPRPDGLEVRVEGKRLTIVRVWRTWSLIFLTGWALMWDSMMFPMIWREISRGHLSAATFMSVHFCVGVFVTYYTLAHWVNDTEITVADGELTISHGPLPWIGDIRRSVHDLDQLYVVEESAHTWNRGWTKNYRLNAVTTNGRCLKLLTLSEREEAVYIEDQVEKHIGIADRRVPGELPRSA